MIEVCVVGELNLDLILYGLPENPLPDHEHLASSMAFTLGSSSGIFAHNLSVLGTEVGFISKIGNDPLGKMAAERLSAAGVDISRMKQGTGKHIDRSYGGPASYPAPVYVHLSGNHVRNAVFRRRLGLPSQRTPFSSFIVLFAPCSPSSNREFVSASQASRTHYVPRHQRRSRKSMGSGFTRGPAIRGCFSAQRSRGKKNCRAPTILRRRLNFLSGARKNRGGETGFRCRNMSERQ